VALLMICLLGFLAHFYPTELGPKANPADTQYVPRPEWYYLPIFQWLKYFKGPLAVVGIVVIPAMTAILVIALPFIDRRLERRPWRRPIAVGIYLAILGTLIAFGLHAITGVSCALTHAEANKIKHAAVAIVMSPRYNLK
jgi:quinol-cytochrome oxidoreductase complex cytochrome b subunit